MSRVKELENIINDPSIWDDKDYAESIISELNSLKSVTDDINNLVTSILDYIETVELLELTFDQELMDELVLKLSEIQTLVNNLSLSLLLSGEHDHCNCILEVHSGAGGTEACDWAEMLFRMYTRYALSKNYKVETIDYQDGDEAGIKKASIMISGLNAYGYLKCEKGVHRLVRLSPFDANNKRHTSFASIDVTPVFDNTVDIVLKDEDLKIDVYRSGGAGGQSVNTTDSAVRVTHLPSKIVVTCQNERSQLQNKEKAFEILRNKLKLIEIEKKELELNALKGSNKNIEFGSQIRSYVMHPYSMVKDLRTGYETSNVSKVLDGDLDMFINSYLKEIN